LKLPQNNNVVLGIDPGLATTGWGVIEKTHASLQLLSYGAIETEPGQPLPQRLLQIQQQLALLIDAYRPSVMAIEELFFTKFAVSIASTAQARGAILLTATLKEIPIVEYNPRSVKIAITGFGSASKIQMQTMLQRHFRLKELPKPDDAADALAMALCHVQTKTQFRLPVSRKMKLDFEKGLALRAGVVL
jgi:crossover junction endodeoxyribonuclease RuvC